MKEITLFLIIVLAMLWCAAFDISIYTPLVIVGIVAAGIFVIWLIRELQREDKVNRAVSAELISIVPVYNEKTVHTGYSVSWNSARDYYRYVNVFDHNECTFRVVYKDGRTGKIKCSEGDSVYRKLMEMTNNATY